jgi:tetratricopeptide (TPR) repeat protein
MVFLTAFAVRFLYIYEFKNDLFLDCLILDLKYYHEWALRIASGDLLGDAIFEMTPLYAYLLGFVYKFVTTDAFLLKLMQVVVGSTSAVLIYMAALEVLEKRAYAFIAGLAASLYGPFIFFDAMRLKTFLAPFFALLMALFILKARRGGVIYPFMAGVSLVLTALIRENVVLLIPIVPLWFFVSAGMERRKHKALAFAVGVILALLPTTIRNYYVGGEFVAITTGGGEVFYIGNYERADGGYIAPDFIRPDPATEHEDFRREAERRVGKELTRKESSRFWYAETLRHIAGHPAQFSKLMWLKLRMFWNYFEYADNYNYYFHRLRSTVLGLPLVHFGIIAPLGLMGFFLSLGAFRRLGVLHVIFLAYMISVLAFFNFDRFRIPAVPFVIIFASYAVMWLHERFKSRAYGRLATALAVSLPLFYFMNTDVQAKGHASYKLDMAYANNGACYANAGRLDLALADFEKAIEINPEHSTALVGAGRVYLQKADYDKALDRFKKAVEVNPGMPQTHAGLGLALFKAGRLEEAIGEFESAVRLEPTNAFNVKFLAAAYEAAGRSGEARRLGGEGR